MSDVTLKEFIEKILEAHDRAHTAQHEAVTIAAVELARRLDVLNHAHERSLEDRAAFQTRDAAEAATKSLATETRNLAALMDSRIKQLEEFRSRAVGIGAVLVLFAAAVGAAVARALGG